MNTTNVDDKNIELETYTCIKDIRHNCYDIKAAFKKIRRRKLYAI